ncbi:LysR family transcriptional regulator, partial [Aeromonas veronii]|nr:LysR family transcriptional regulator [Aeromonas veronii]
ALVPASHPWAALPKGIRREQLNEVIMVLREPSSITRRTFDDACLAVGVQPKVLLELDSREAETEAVAAELGVGVVSSMEVSPDPRVRAVPIHGNGLVNRHMLGCMERRRSLRLIQAFFELAP